MSDSTEGTEGTRDTTTASSQGGPKATSTIDDTNHLTLVDTINSQDSLRKGKARARPRAKYHVELPKPKASDIEAILQLNADGEHPE